MTPELQILSWDVEPEPRRWRGFAVGDRVRAISDNVDARTWFDARNDRPLVIPRGTTGTVVSIDTGAGVEVDWDGYITAMEAYGDDPSIVGWGNDPEDLELTGSNIILSWDITPTTYPYSDELWQPETVRTWPQRFVVGDIIMGPSGENNYYTILQLEPDIVIHSHVSDADFVADPSAGRWSRRSQASVLAPVRAWDTTAGTPEVGDWVKFVQDDEVLDEINLNIADVMGNELWQIVNVDPNDAEWPTYRAMEDNPDLPEWGIGNIKVNQQGFTWSIPLSHWERYIVLSRKNSRASLQVRAWDTGHKIPWAEWKDWDTEGLTPERGYLTLQVGDVLTYANGDEPERPVYEVIAAYPPRVRFLIVDDKSLDTKGKVLVYEPEHEPEWYMEPIIEASILSRAWTVEPEPRIWEPGSWERSMEEISGVLKVGDVLSEHPLHGRDWQVIEIEPDIKIQLVLDPRERYVYDISTDNWHQVQESSLEVRAWDTRGEAQFYVGDRVRIRDCSRGSRAWNAITHTFTVPAGGLGTVKEFPSKWGPEYVGVDWDGFPQAQDVFTDRTDIVGWSTRIENVELVGTYD